MHDKDGFTPLPIMVSTDFNEYDDPKEFRQDFPLQNARGEKMLEHSEITEQRAHRLRGSANLTICWATLLAVAYMLPRLSSSSCFEEYRRLLVTKRYCESQNMTFPPDDISLQDSAADFCKTVSSADVKHLLLVHMLHVDGSHNDLPLICFPFAKETVSSCEGDWPDGLKRPTLLGINCPSQICRFSEMLENSFLDYIFLGLLVVLYFGACVCKCLEIKRERYERQVPDVVDRELPPNFDSANHYR